MPFNIINRSPITQVAVQGQANLAGFALVQSNIQGNLNAVLIVATS